MSTFDIRPDAPGLLRIESINITIKFDRTSPTTGRISWNIPSPAPGCTAATQAYCGMLVTIDTKPASAEKIPKRGEVYSSDATGDVNLFAGDKLGTALIIGAFYEDRDTTFFDIDGLKPNTPYFVSGFPVDCQYRYFIEGVHAYSQDFKNRGTDGTSGTQVVVLNSDAQVMGVNPEQYTGLDAALEYEFTIQLGLDPKQLRQLDVVEPRLVTPTYTISVVGEDAQTYEDLVAAINRRLALLRNAAQGPTAPNAGSYYFNTSRKKLFLWNGSEHIDVPCLIEPTQPDSIVSGAFWYDETASVLKRFNGTVWTAPVVQSVTYDPAAPQADATYFYTGSAAQLWNGVTWCQIPSFYTDAVDPSLAANPAAGSYWFDDVNNVLYRWNDAADMWLRTSAVQSRQDPTILTNGTYWFNDLTNQLSIRTALGWDPLSNVSLAEVAPLTPATGKMWYKPTTLQLFRYSGTLWAEQDVIVHSVDPTITANCDVWWDVDTDTLYQWSLSSSWTPISAFFIQTNDPAAAPTISDGSAWYNAAEHQLYIYENNCFKKVQFLTSQTAVNGEVWHNPTTGVWKERVSGAWSVINPVDSPTDPRSLPTNTFWFNSSNSGLNRWNGASWTSVTFSSSPLTPNKGTLWFDTTTDLLKEWNGAVWVASTPMATVGFDANNNLLFVDTNIGSNSGVRLADISLFRSLEIAVAFHPGKAGTDGASDEPSYSELGIGTDGSDAARNTLINDLRYELGYPVMDVELTKEQMDYAVDRAISELRSHSSLAYKRGFFFMAVPQNEQRLFLTSKRDRHNRIVDILGCYRLTSAFVSSAHGAGVYGQMLVQHLYNAGNFDLLSFHLMAEHTKLLEMLFAGRLTFTWNEQTREIFIHNRFSVQEQHICIEATEERTEQDLLTDRYTKSWIRRYAASVARLMLSEIRGKFSTLPGAGGSVSLNASDLRQAAQQGMEECMQEIADYVADRPEEFGMGTTFLFG